MPLEMAHKQAAKAKATPNNNTITTKNNINLVTIINYC